MALEKYNSKRDFKNSPEPKGKKEKASKKLYFVIQHHMATKEHYDLRLEHNGVLLSWAVPKGLSLSTKERRLAVMVEDHPISYKDFEGIIPKGNYGAGSVEIYDCGFYTQNINFDDGLKKGHLKFALNGKLLKGEWNLIKTYNQNWILIKSGDKHAKNITPTKRVTKNPFKTISPMLATLCSQIPKGKDWVYEIKYDGYRAISFVENGKAKILSRNGNNFTAKFKIIAKNLESLAKNTPLVLDGEIVSFDLNGKSDFGLLLKNIKSKSDNFAYVVFDVLAYNGNDLTNNTLLERKAVLNSFLPKPYKNILPSSVVNKKGKECFNIAKKLGLEGIVAKNLNSTYEQKRSENWLKIKCCKRQEFVIGGYTISDKNDILSAILVGYYKDKNLIFIGKVGTGFSNEIKNNLIKCFKPLIQKNSPFLNLQKSNNTFWLNPNLVAEIKYTEITKEHLLRQPSFVGLRSDKSPNQIVLEENL